MVHIVSNSFVIPQMAAHQAPLSIEFSRQEYGSGQSFLSPGDLSDSGMEPGSPALQADSLPSEPPGKPYDTTYIWNLKYDIIYEADSQT